MFSLSNELYFLRLQNFKPLTRNGKWLKGTTKKLTHRIKLKMDAQSNPSSEEALPDNFIALSDSG